MNEKVEQAFPVECSNCGLPIIHSECDWRHFDTSSIFCKKVRGKATSKAEPKEQATADGEREPIMAKCQGCGGDIKFVSTLPRQGWWYHLNEDDCRKCPLFPSPRPAANPSEQAAGVGGEPRKEPEEVCPRCNQIESQCNDNEYCGQMGRVKAFNARKAASLKPSEPLVSHQTPETLHNAACGKETLHKPSELVGGEAAQERIHDMRCSGCGTTWTTTNEDSHCPNGCVGDTISIITHPASPATTIYKATCDRCGKSWRYSVALTLCPHCDNPSTHLIKVELASRSPTWDSQPLSESSKAGLLEIQRTIEREVVVANYGNYHEQKKALHSQIEITNQLRVHCQKTEKLLMQAQIDIAALRDSVSPSPSPSPVREPEGNKTAADELCAECGHPASKHEWHDDHMSCCMTRTYVGFRVGEGAPCMCTGFKSQPPYPTDVESKFSARRDTQLYCCLTCKNRAAQQRKRDREKA